MSIRSSPRRSLGIASAAIAALAGASLVGAVLTGCESRQPCIILAERDCARHGAASAICREARRRAAHADRYLVEVCRKVVERGEAAWRPLDAVRADVAR